MKKRRFPLARTVKCFLNRPKTENLRLAKAKSPRQIKQDELKGIFAYLKSTWVPGDTPLSIEASRPVDTEYYPTYFPSTTVIRGRSTNTDTAEKTYKYDFSTTYKKQIVEFPAPVSRFAETDDEEDY